MEQVMTSTNWLLESSFKFDVLCFTGILTGDPFYVHYYPDEYSRWETLLTPEVRDALEHVKTTTKARGGIVSAGLCHLLSAVEDEEELPALVARLENLEPLWEALRTVAPENVASDQAYLLSIRDSLRLIWNWLETVGFSTYWKQEILPTLQARNDELAPFVANYDVIPIIERVLDKRLDTHTVTIYVQYFNKPHGMKLIGARYITHRDYDPANTVRIAIHELMHPPYDLPNDEALRRAFDPLRDDAFFMDKVLNHNPSFGYNSFEGMVEENVVQGLEQTIADVFGVGAPDPKQRWQVADDGIHVLAAGLYGLMQREDFVNRGETIRAFLLRHLAPGGALRDVKQLYDSFYQ
jgi:hypothetical protein